MDRIAGQQGDPRRRVLKLYQQIRTAHLERALESQDEVTFLYQDRRYDFDETIARQVDLRHAGTLGVLRHCLTHEVDVIETNEPLAWLAAGRGVAAALGNRVRSLLLRRDRALVVSYAIENKDPRTWAPRLRGRARLRWYSAQPAVRLLWLLTDRVAFGTHQSQKLHQEWFSPSRRWPHNRLVPALPARPQLGLDETGRPPTVVFLGDLSSRKGFNLLLSAWPEVRREREDAHLVILGKGAGAEQARALASQDGSVVCHIDPSRELIRQVLHTVKVLVLASQPTPTWREQVGLPVVEGLEAGCVVVTTDQTGLATWLSQHGHVVLPAPTSGAALAAGIVTALTDPRAPTDVVRPLPSRDGRRAAQDWLFGALTPTGGADDGRSDHDEDA